MTEIRQILNSAAMELANKLDGQDDGGKDGKIEASIWNEFVKDKGGKTIQSSITIENARKSITTYLFNAANQLGKSVADVAKSWGVSGTQADTAVDETNNDDSATKPAGGNKGNGNAKFSTASIKVTVPPAYISKEAKSIIKNSQDGVKLGQLLKKGETKGITKDNVAYAAAFVHFGQNTQKQAIIVYNALKQRYEELYNKKVKTTEEAFKKLSFNDQNKWIQGTATLIKKRETKIIKDAVNSKDYQNKNHAKIQQCFDNANKALVDAANNKSNLKIRKNDDGSKETTLPDGRWIRVYYDTNGEIDKIAISYDSTPDHRKDGSTDDEDEVFYTKDKACYDIDHSNDEFEGSITSGYNFEKLKKIAESIFGKNT